MIITRYLKLIVQAKRMFLKLTCCLVLVPLLHFSQQKMNKAEVRLEAVISELSQRLKTSIVDSIAVYSKLYETVEQAEKLDSDILRAKAYNNLASWHNLQNSLDSVRYYYIKSAKFFKKSNSQLREAESYLKLEDVYKQLGEYSEAMLVDFKALELYENLNERAGIARVYTRLCDLLYYQQKYQEGIDYCQKAIDIQEKINVPDDLAISYRYKADNLLILEQYQEALKNINKAIAVLKNQNRTELDIAPNYNTRGNIYKYLERYDEAVAEYKKCYQIANASNNPRGVISALGNIGHVYRLTGNDNEAIPYILKAIAFMKKSGIVQNLSENYLHAAASYKAIGNYEEALLYKELYAEIKLSELHTIIEQLESELQIKYETDKKNETIEIQESQIDRQKRIQLLYYGIGGLLSIILLGMYLTIKNIKKKRLALQEANNQINKNQKDLKKSNQKLKVSLRDLKATQNQLIHAEKMASLGELTAGIAHEIQNPLNFVNNFSELNDELIDEMKTELKKGDYEEVIALSNDIKDNQNKITHHGKRADAIVKGMLQHSRSGSNEKEPTNLNALTDEYFRLAYHGLRAKDKSFNATLVSNYDESIGKVSIVAQDIGRVILNLFTNAFYAVDEKRAKIDNTEFKPTVTVSTKKINDTVEIKVKDNGNGIPKHVISKIFQPFFTTKPAGKGTGLGLSMSYDIITAQGGDLKVNTKENEGTEFIIFLPVKD